MPGGAMMNSKPIKVDEQLEYLKLRFMGEQYRALADEAAKNSWSHQQYFECLIKGETDLRWDNGIKRRITMARFPVLKTLDQLLVSL
jgi:DNA replication protein DnaC